MIRNNERQYKSKKREEEEREKKEVAGEREEEKGRRGIELTDLVKQVYCASSILTFK